MTQGRWCPHCGAGIGDRDRVCFACQRAVGPASEPTRTSAMARAGWQTLPFRLPIAHAPLLLVGTAVQLLFVLIAFLFKASGTSWEIGAYLALLAALAACAIIAVPAIRSAQATQQR